jgi:hypothetical protein
MSIIPDRQVWKRAVRSCSACGTDRRPAGRRGSVHHWIIFQIRTRKMVDIGDFIYSVSFFLTSLNSSNK